MFNQSLVCPKKENIQKEKNTSEGCKGCRENGVLKNECAARCHEYKKYVQSI